MDQQTGHHPATVAIITGQLTVGGAERQLYLWLANLDRKLFNPVVVTLHPGFGDYWESLIEGLSIPVLRVPRRVNRLARLLEITRVLRPYHPKLIHAWHLFASPYAGAAARLIGAKSLGSLRSSIRSFQNSYLESRLTLLLVNSLLVNSYSAGTQLKQMRKRKAPDVHVVVNAVEDQANDRFAMRQSLSSLFGISAEQIWIGSMGRLEENKRFDLLLKVVAMLQNDVKDFHFLLIGDGPDKSRLQRMAEDLDINRRVSFVGEIRAARTWLSALDIFCFASLDEGLPNVIMEAAAANVPIVSWCTPFIKELLDNGKAGILVDPPGNTIRFKDMLLNLIHSPELRIELGKTGHDHVLENFSVERYVEQITGIYNGLLDFGSEVKKGR